MDALEQDNTELPSGQEIFDRAVNPHKEETKPVKEEETSEQKAERARDEKGRFAPKAQEEEAPKDEAPAEKTKPEPENHIPSWRLKEEADARREALARAEAAERQAQQLQAYLADVQRQMEQLKPQPEPVDMFADPQAWQAQQQQTVEQRLKSMEANFSLRLAHYKHGDTFTEAYQDIISRPLNDPVRQQVINSPDPGETLVQLYQREKVYGEIGGDPTAYVNKKLEEALSNEEFLAKAVEAWKARAGVQPTQNKIELPNSLNKVAASQGNSSENLDMSDGAVFKRASASRRR